MTWVGIALAAWFFLSIPLALFVAGLIGRGSAKPAPTPPRTWIRAA